MDAEKTGSVEVEMNGGSHENMREDRIYNRAENLIYVKTNGDTIYVICNTEEQTDKVVQKLTTPQCKLASYEEWDEGADKKWILTFMCIEDGYEIQPELN